MFLYYADDVLLEIHGNPSRKWRDRCTAKQNTVSTFR